MANLGGVFLIVKCERIPKDHLHKWHIYHPNISLIKVITANLADHHSLLGTVFFTLVLILAHSMTHML
jgi:hypothetical protein